MHGYSVEAQKQALTEYARKNNLHIVDYYVDEGQTARKSYKKRKEFIRLMDDVKVGNIDIILFIKLDRWFRNIRDYYKIQDILEKHKVNWKTIFENYDTTTASGLSKPPVRRSRIPNINVIHIGFSKPPVRRSSPSST